MSFDSDTELSLDSKKRRRIFDDEFAEGEEDMEMNDQYAVGFRRLKKMGLDENMWSE